MKVAGEFRRFQADHPKVAAFAQKEIQSGIPENSVVEITITKPGADPVTCNFRVLAKDVEMVENLRKLQ